MQSILPADPTSPVAVVAKMMLDQAIMAPVMTSVFFMTMKSLDGQPEEAVDHMRSKLKPTLLANWTVWPLAHVINFGLVPSSQRILYVNVVNVSGHGCCGQCANRAPSVS